MPRCTGGRRVTPKGKRSKHRPHEGAYTEALQVRIGYSVAYASGEEGTLGEVHQLLRLRLHEKVLAGAGVETVGVAAAVEAVTAGAAVEAVLAIAAVEAIVARRADERVVAIAA